MVRIIRIARGGRRSRVAERPVDYEDELAAQIRLAGLPEPERQFRFAPPRKFASDLAYPHLPPGRRFLVEIEGGTWAPTPGRHNHPVGFGRDLEKYNLAALLGYRLLRFTPDQVESGVALKTIEAALLGADLPTSQEI